MQIQTIDIERMSNTQEYCGNLEYELETGSKGSLLWTVECQSSTRINVAFVQGSASNWDKIAQEHAHYLSDNIILVLARRQDLPVLSAA